MATQTIIPNKKNLDKKISALIKDGSAKLHLLADFDRTLTRAFVRGRSVPALVAILRNHDYLGPEYSRQAFLLYNKYQSIGENKKISFRKKSSAMRQWWTLHYALLKKSGLTKSIMVRAMRSQHAQLRTGAKQLLKTLNDKTIPLVIVSSAGLGQESIEIMLRHNRCRYKNITIISNQLRWDRSGRFVGVKSPIIHALNKDGRQLKKIRAFEKIKGRHNIILLGNNPYDISMSAGFKFKNIIKIGFFNEKKTWLKEFRRLYDIIIPNDGSMKTVNQLLKSINASK